MTGRCGPCIVHVVFLSEEIESEGDSSSVFSLELLGEMSRCFRVESVPSSSSFFSSISCKERFPFVFSSGPLFCW